MKILVGYDDSDASEEALKVAIEHARAFHAQILLLTSLKGGTETSQDDIQKATENLEKAKKICDNAGISGEVHLLVKGLSPGEDIVSFAEENKAYEIIIGIRKRSKVGKLIFGSDAQHVILSAPCPVLSVKPPITD